MADLAAEAEACGSKIKMPEDALPSVVEHLPIKTIEDIKKLRIPDPSTDGRLPVFIEATALFKKRFALPQFAIATGPFTLASELIGTDIIARKVFKDPPLVHALMQFSLKVLQRYSHALLEAGADLIGLRRPLLQPGFRQSLCRIYSSLSSTICERNAGPGDYPCLRPRGWYR